MTGKKYLTKLLLIVLIISNCSTPPNHTSSDSQTPTANQIEQEITEDGFDEAGGLAVTNVVIDGDSSDWLGYPILAEDSQNDYEGGDFDIKAIRGFLNDKYLYILIETYQLPSEYVQVDLIISTNGKRYIASFRPQDNGPVFLGDISDGTFQEIGNINNSYSAVLDSVEVKIPLVELENFNQLDIEVNAMGGTCCDTPAWYIVDAIEKIVIPELDEKEPNTNQLSICKKDIPPQKPFGESIPAPQFQIAEGYSAEWFIPPGPFNMPQEILLTPDGKILVYAVRSHALFEIDLDGNVKSMIEDVWGYQGTVDDSGNIALHMHPNGWLTRISSDGDVERILESEELASACDSGISFGPGGDLFVAISDCQGSGNLYSINEEGEISNLGVVPDLNALRLSPDGRLIGASSNSIFEINLKDVSTTLIGKIPTGEIASGGIAFNEKGLLFISTGGRRNSGALYQMDISSSDPEIQLIAIIPENGISGIEWLPDYDLIIGGQLRSGGILSVSLDGKVSTIIEGNGIITPMGIEFSPCGELAVPNDDGGMMSLVYPDGETFWLMDYLSFIPPIPFVSFDPDGTMYASEGAPMLMPQRISVLKIGDGESLQTLTNAEYPSGLARRSDGILFFSETSAGKISLLSSDGTVKTFINDLVFPQSIAFDLDGNLYAIIGKPSGFDLIENPDIFPVPSVGDQIIKIAPSGQIIDRYKIEGASAIAVNSQNNVFISVSNMFSSGRDSRVMIINAEGELKQLATGFDSAVGLSFDVAGNLYVSDESTNGILRIGGFPQGKIKGIIVDQNGNVIAGARVQVMRIVPEVVGQIVFTDDNGEFEIIAEPNTYSLHVESAGYEINILDRVFINIDQVTNVYVTLEE